MIAVVYGPAACQGSKRLVRTRGGNTLMLDADPRLRSWRGQMQAEMLRTAPEGGPLDGAVRLQVTVCVPRPKAHYRTGRNAHLLRADAPPVPANGRDLDKVLRAVGDAGTGIWWQDDSRIAMAVIVRVYADSGAGERVIVEAEGVDGEEVGE